MTSAWRWAIGGAMAAVLALSAGPAPAQSGPVKMEWLSWSIFRFTSPGGKIIVTNPFVTNPDSPVKVPDFPKVDVIVVADGHGDEVGSTHEIAIAHRRQDHHAATRCGAPISSRETSPRRRCTGASPATGTGSTASPCATSTRCTGRERPTSCTAGRRMGFMLQFENGLTVYFAGSTALTMDMQLWGMLYKPDVAILPLSSEPRSRRTSSRWSGFSAPRTRT